MVNEKILLAYADAILAANKRGESIADIEKDLRNDIMFEPRFLSQCLNALHDAATFLKRLGCEVKENVED